MKHEQFYPSSQDEPTTEALQRDFLAHTISKTHLASFIPTSFKEVITDIAIEMKKIQTIDEAFQKAGEHDTLMSHEDNKYEQTVRKEYENYTRFARTEAATLQYIKRHMAFDLAKGRLHKEVVKQNIVVPRNTIIASSTLCVALTEELAATIVPNPKYL